MCDKPYSLKIERPFTVTGKHHPVTHIDVPCGKCEQCKASKVREWIFRLEQECRTCDSARFIGLSYDELYVPKTELGYNTLKYKDIQEYLKALRHKEGKRKNKTKFFCVGEYGSEKYRPHWHLIIFNATDDNIVKSWNRKGTVDIGYDCSPKAMQYMMDYLQKPQFDNIVKKYPDFDGKKEMRHMSQGIGASFLHKEETWEKYSTGSLDNVKLSSGQEIRLPKYYRDKMYTENMHETKMQEQYIKHKNIAAREIWMAKKQHRDYAREQRNGRKKRQQTLDNFSNKIRDYHA